MNDELFKALLGDPTLEDKDFKIAMKHHWCVVKQSCLNEYGQLLSFRAVYRCHPKYREDPTKATQADDEFDKIVARVAGKDYMNNMKELISQRSSGFVIHKEGMRNIGLRALSSDFNPKSDNANLTNMLNHCPKGRNVQISCIDRPIAVSADGATWSKVDQNGLFTRRNWAGLSVPCMLRVAGVDLNKAPWNQLAKYGDIRDAIKIKDTSYVMCCGINCHIYYNNGDTLAELPCDRLIKSFGPKTAKTEGKLSVVTVNDEHIDIDLSKPGK